MAITPKYIFAEDFRDLEDYFLSCLIRRSPLIREIISGSLVSHTVESIT